MEKCSNFGKTKSVFLKVLKNIDNVSYKLLVVQPSYLKNSKISALVSYKTFSKMLFTKFCE